MKPYWFKIIEDDGPKTPYYGNMLMSRKDYQAIIIFFSVFIGVIGIYFLIPQKVADPVITPITTPSPIINSMINPSYEDDYDEEEDNDQ